MLACATIAPGLRPVVHQEASRSGIDPVQDQLENEGWAAFSVGGPAQLVAGLGQLRTIHRWGVVLAKARVDPADPWEQLDDLVAKIDPTDWFADGPFAVRGHRIGQHGFTSMDLAAHVGAALHDRLEAHLGRRPPVDLERPDAILRVHMDEDGHVRLWLDLTGQEGLHRRGYRERAHPAGMKASLASGLFELAGSERVGPVADPMAGAGTLVAEAAWRRLDVAPARLRAAELLAWNAPALAPLREETLTRWTAPVDREGATRLVLGDHAPNRVEDARRNLEQAGVLDIVDTYVGDVESLPSHLDEAALVVANPPYGIRSGEHPLDATYERLFSAAEDVLVDEGHLGLMTPQTKLVKRLADEHGMRVVENVEVKHGRLTIALLVLQGR